jgi:hypothetical protein
MKRKPGDSAVIGTVIPNGTYGIPTRSMPTHA